MKPLKVLVIDDSFTMRLLISDFLQSDPDISLVKTVKSGEEALDIIPLFKPDCITLDLVMPGMDGLTTLKKIMRQYPRPVIILSAYSKADADITFKCLANGAISFIPKPGGELSLDIKDIQKKLLMEIKAIGQKTGLFYLPQSEKLEKIFWQIINQKKLIVFGASTGGPETLEMILSHLPFDLPVPILIAQHMPRGSFLQSFVDRLNKNTWIKVKIAEHEEPIQEGFVYCVPSGFIGKLRENGNENIFWLEPENSQCQSPSIDALMNSAADIYEQKTIGIILSGMGEDGLEGMRKIKLKGGVTIAQDETALLFGMPKAVIERGLADKILPLEEIPYSIKELLKQ